MFEQAEASSACHKSRILMWVSGNWFTLSRLRAYTMYAGQQKSYACHKSIIPMCVSGN